MKFDEVRQDIVFRMANGDSYRTTLPAVEIMDALDSYSDDKTYIINIGSYEHGWQWKLKVSDIMSIEVRDIVEEEPNAVPRTGYAPKRRA